MKYIKEVGFLIFLSGLLQAMDKQNIKLRKEIKKLIECVVVVKTEVNQEEINRIAGSNTELKKDLKALCEDLQSPQAPLKLKEFCKTWKIHKELSLPSTSTSPIVGGRRTLRASDNNLITNIPEVPFRSIDDNNLYFNGEGRLE